VLLLLVWAVWLLQVSQHAGGRLHQQAAAVCQAQQEGLDAWDEDLPTEVEAEAKADK
jgi:hypothetical protein